MPTVEIEGIVCSYRSKREDEKVLFSEYEKSEQYFRRIEHVQEDKMMLNPPSNSSMLNNKSTE